MLLIKRNYIDNSDPLKSILTNAKGKALVKLSKILYKSDMMSAAHLSILKAREVGEESSVFQMAKWSWRQRLNQEAINTLSRAISCSSNIPGSLLQARVLLSF
jgi:hypothetical protein